MDIPESGFLRKGIRGGSAYPHAVRPSWERAETSARFPRSSPIISTPLAVCASMPPPSAATPDGGPGSRRRASAAAIYRWAPMGRKYRAQVRVPEIQKWSGVRSALSTLIGARSNRMSSLICQTREVASKLGALKRGSNCVMDRPRPLSAAGPGTVLRRVSSRRGRRRPRPL